MLRRNLSLLAKHGREEIMSRGRRVEAGPMMQFRHDRLRSWQERFKEMGPRYSKVWVALGGQMRRRRIGRDRDRQDKRYYWRPIEQQFQRTYQRQLRFLQRNNKWSPTPPLRADNLEIGRATSGPEWVGNRTKFGVSNASAKPLDWEFRVW